MIVGAHNPDNGAASSPAAEATIAQSAQGAAGEDGASEPGGVLEG